MGLGEGSSARKTGGSQTPPLRKKSPGIAWWSGRWGIGGYGELGIGGLTGRQGAPGLSGALDSRLWTPG